MTPRSLSCYDDGEFQAGPLAFKATRSQQVEAGDKKTAMEYNTCTLPRYPAGATRCRRVQSKGSEINNIIYGMAEQITTNCGQSEKLG
jgi:hypothetical protein